MKKLKVATIVGTRPELIRLSRVIAALDRHTEHYLIHTGQNYDYELNGIFFSDLNIRKPDIFLDAAGSNALQTIGKVIATSGQVLLELKPDAVLILGDTNSCLSAIAAKRLKIPVFHMEAGNRCFDMRVPEELNRRIVDHTSDINLTYSKIAREYLLREGLDPQRVIVTGSPMREVLEHYSNAIDASDILSRLDLKKDGYFLVSAHREENIDDDNKFGSFLELLNALAVRFDIPIIVSTHPRTRNKIDSADMELDARIRTLKPFGFLDYVQLQKQSYAVLSDSGTITEESSILNLRAINIRDTHERPEGMEEGAVMMTGMNTERVMQCLGILESQSRENERTILPVSDYSTPNVSEKVVRIIHSYTDFVNRVVWQKEVQSSRA